MVNHHSRHHHHKHVITIIIIIIIIVVVVVVVVHVVFSGLATIFGARGKYALRPPLNEISNFEKPEPFIEFPLFCAIT
jgi:flagellar basal body-associated protein FliL